MTKNHYRHAYRDYHGPRLPGTKRRCKADMPDDEEEQNPLKTLAWEKGDSLAPPCGSSVSIIHAMLEFASVNRNDVLYDLGCGDGRVILEGLVKTKCKQCVGVELEEALVARGQELIGSLPANYRYEESPQDPMSLTSQERIQVVHGNLRKTLKDLVGRVYPDENGKRNDDDDYLSEDRPYQTLPFPTVIFLHLLPEGIAETEQDLLKLLPHIRIVCLAWGLKGIRPIAEKEVYDRRTKAGTTVFLYTSECFERLKGFEYMLTVYNYGH